jgi:tetratricopeptide (TPR) repeat protein
LESFFSKRASFRPILKVSQAPPIFLQSGLFSSKIAFSVESSKYSDFKNAIANLEKFKSDDAILKPIALGAIGDALSETNKVDDAISYYKQAAEASENDFTTPRYLFKAAQLYLTAGKKSEANKLFIAIKEKYETSKEGMNIDAFIEMTE